MERAEDPTINIKRLEGMQGYVSGGTKVPPKPLASTGRSLSLRASSPTNKTQKHVKE